LAVDLRKTWGRRTGPLDRRDPSLAHHDVPAAVAERGRWRVEDTDVPHHERPGSPRRAGHQERLAPAGHDEDDDRHHPRPAAAGAHCAVNPPSATISAPVT